MSHESQSLYKSKYVVLMSMVAFSIVIISKVICEGLLVSKMPRRFVVSGCSDSVCDEIGVWVHIIQFSGDKRPAVVTLRKR